MVKISCIKLERGSCMIKKKHILLVLFVIFGLLIVLAACVSKGVDTESQTSQHGVDESGIPRGGTAILSMSSAPRGVFNPTLYNDAYEYNVMSFIYESLVRQDQNLEWEPFLAKSWYYENDHKTLVFELNEGITWHDGQPFTANDVKFTYEVIGHPDYTGSRRNVSVANLVGIDEYMSGEADELVGIEVVDDHTIKFHFQEPNIMALRDASFMIIPQHIFENIPVAKHREALESSEFEKLVGTGPFKVTTDWLAGVYYRLERFDDYWKGSSYLDDVIWRVVEPELAPDLLQNGEIDIITVPTGVLAEDVDYIESIPGVKVYESPGFGYQYLGFKFHHRTPSDVDNDIYNPDNWEPNTKLHDVKLRHAMAYAIDREKIVQHFLNGHGTVMHAPLPQVSWAYDESVANTYPFNPKKAKQILAEAGYIDVTGDGWLEDPNGDELIFRLDYPTGNIAREQSAIYIQEALAEVGIRIDLRTPREARTLFDAIADEEPEIELYLAGWNLSAADPNPLDLWDTTSPYNYTRWVDEKSQSLLHAAVKTPEAFDQQYRTEIYKEWIEHISDQLPKIFLYAENNIWAYSTKINNIQEGPLHIYQDVHLWYIGD